jgi:hypothetical protein
MNALEFWKAVTVDRSELLEGFLGILSRLGVRYCVIGGQGVNAYADPVVSLDLDIVVAVSDFSRLRDALPPSLKVREFPHSLNISEPSSRLQIQIQTDSRYFSFVDRAELHDVLDLQLPVATIEDLLQGKVWAALDPERRASKRQKDLADIARLLEVRPELRSQVPNSILAKLL